MKINNKTRRKFIFHPILLGLYPVLALYAFNRNEIVVGAIQQAVITSLIITAVVISVFLLVLRSWERAAVQASLSFLLFYSYGHVYDFAQAVSLFGRVIGRDRFLVPVWVLLFIIGQVFLARSKKDPLNEILNSMSLVLVIFLFVQIVIPLVRFGNINVKHPERPTLTQSSSSSTAIDRDVYYILVDAYSRQDLLQARLNLDTSDFITNLLALGFYIPNCAQSNYPKTLPSMTATLNMNYLEPLGLKYGGDDAGFEPYLQKNLVMDQFKGLGYSLATFKSVYPPLDFPQATYYYDYFKDVSVLDSQASLNFQYLFLNTTFLRSLISFLERNPDITIPSYLATWIPLKSTLKSREYRQYLQNLFALDSLQKMPNIPGKKFVYAHLFITHQPYVFYPDGKFHPFLQQDDSAYRDQVIYADTRLLEILKTILTKSNPAPIIILQGDHSFFWDEDRVKILNAYYFPDGGDKTLYSTITPVNSFRVLFNTYFGGQFTLLPDNSKYPDQNDVLQVAPSTCMNGTSP